MTLKIGLVVGREWSWPPAFIEEIRRRNEGVEAEYVKLGTPRIDDPARYAVIIGDDEAAAQQVTLKSLRGTAEQTRVELALAIDALKNATI